MPLRAVYLMLRKRMSHVNKNPCLGAGGLKCMVCHRVYRVHLSAGKGPRPRVEAHRRVEPRTRWSRVRWFDRISFERDACTARAPILCRSWASSTDECEVKNIAQFLFRGEITHDQRLQILDAAVVEDLNREGRLTRRKGLGQTRRNWHATWHWDSCKRFCRSI